MVYVRKNVSVKRAPIIREDGLGGIFIKWSLISVKAIFEGIVGFIMVCISNGLVAVDGKAINEVGGVKDHCYLYSMDYLYLY